MLSLIHIYYTDTFPEPDMAQIRVTCRRKSRDLQHHGIRQIQIPGRKGETVHRCIVETRQDVYKRQVLENEAGYLYVAREMGLFVSHVPKWQSDMLRCV